MLNENQHKLLYYILNYIAIVLALSISVFLYTKTMDSAGLFIKSHLYNMAATSLLTIITMFATGLVSYHKRIISIWKSYTFLITLGFVLLSILIAYLVESLVFFHNRIGRTIYLYYLVLLSVFFLLRMEHYVRVYLRKMIQYVWMDKEDSLRKIESEYGIHVHSIKTGDMFSSSLPPNSVLLYDPITQQNDHTLLKLVSEGYRAITVPMLVEQEIGIIPLDYLGNYYLIEDFTREKPLQDGLKLLLDYFISPVLFLLLFPLGFLMAVIQSFMDKGPVFYTQYRAGKNERTFKLYKFRTMILNAEQDGIKFSNENDPRVTKLGKIMRKFRLDEVPQLLNVLKGEMSLIGPRPERIELIEKLSMSIPYYRLRLEVKPGLTGWAQVHYKYTGPDIDEQKRKLEYDLYYLKNRNLLLDIIILLKTIGVVLKAEGV